MSAVRVATTVAEVEALRPLQQSFRNSLVTSDLDFVLTYCAHTPGVIRPHVVTVEEEGKPVGLVIARLEDVTMPTKLGYTVVLNPPVRALTVVYGGFLGGADETGAGRLLEALARSIGSEQVDVVRLRMLPVGSPLHTAALRTAPLLRRQRFSTRMPHWRSELTGSLDEFLARRSKRRRETIRRYTRRLERTYGDQARVEVFRDRSGLERLLTDTRSIYTETYQHILGVGFSDAGVQRRLITLAMDRGWFRGYVLYLAEQPVAFWHGNLYHGVFGIGATGFDPAYADDRPGTFLLMRAIEDLCAEGTVHTLDFGFGDADYKRQLGDECVEEADVVLYAARPKAVALNLAQTTVLATAGAARGALARAGKIGALRRRWRSHRPGRRES